MVNNPDVRQSTWTVAFQSRARARTWENLHPAESMAERADAKSDSVYEKVAKAGPTQCSEHGRTEVEFTGIMGNA